MVNISTDGVDFGYEIKIGNGLFSFSRGKYPLDKQVEGTCRVTPNSRSAKKIKDLRVQSFFIHLLPLKAMEKPINLSVTELMTTKFSPD